MSTNTPTLKLRCPACGQREGVELLFGMPSQEAMAAAERGEIALGGCCMPWEPLNYRCLNCEFEWGKPEEPGEPGELGQPGDACQ